MQDCSISCALAVFHKAIDVCMSEFLDTEMSKGVEIPSQESKEYPHCNKVDMMTADDLVKQGVWD